MQADRNRLIQIPTLCYLRPMGKSGTARLSTEICSLGCRWPLLAAMLSVLFTPAGAAWASSLQPHTEKEFSRYVEKVEKSLVSRGSGELRFLQSTEIPGGLARLKDGSELIRNLNEDDDTPDGIIHDWLGARLLKGVSVGEVVELLCDYDAHSRIFPNVVKSKLVSRSGDSLESYLRFRKKKILTVFSDTSHKVEILRRSPDKVQIFSRSTRIQEVQNHGEPDETLLPEGEDSGFLWRMNTYWSIAQAGDGTIVECRSITLSRDVPFGLNLIINPIIKNMPREQLQSMLETLEAVLGK